MGKRPDFTGWATCFNKRCSDGRTIREGAFDDDDGLQVPLVWQHIHDSPGAVLGHALLEKRGEGMYAYCYLNNTDAAQAARESVEHGDITSLSIHANRLKQTRTGDVLHGRIREVSLVLTGANPDARIDQPFIRHSDDLGDVLDEDELIILSGEDIDNIYHADDDYDEDEDDEDDGPTIADVWKTCNEDQKYMVYAIVDQLSAKNAVSHSDDDYDEDDDYDDDEYEEDDYDDYDEDYDDEDDDNDYDDEYEDDDVEHSDYDDDYYEGDVEEMSRRNVFENDAYESSARPSYELTHSDFEVIWEDAKRTGSLRDSFREYVNDICDELSHSDIDVGEIGDNTYGVADIDWLFPEAHNLNNPPDFIKRDTGWVSDVMSSVHHTPFSRIRSTFADITMDEARAKGYTKGNRKTEEVFSLLKRTTTPTTVYKKQKLDRDDKLDITDFDIVAWLKSEMRLMLDEELARAYLVGDGRNALSEDKIKEENIRPIWTDDDLFTIKYVMEVAEDADEDTIANDTIRAAIKSRKDYKGSGNPVMYMAETYIIDMLLLEDGIGNRKYKTREELATACGVRKIVPCPILEGLTRVVTVDGQEQTRELKAIIVNMGDYNVGADKGGAVAMFEDFDIDVNQEKFLIETRCSGALTKPFSAIALEVHKNSTT